VIYLQARADVCRERASFTFARLLSKRADDLPLAAVRFVNGEDTAARHSSPLAHFIAQIWEAWSVRVAFEPQVGTKNALLVPHTRALRYTFRKTFRCLRTTGWGE